MPQGLLGWVYEVKERWNLDETLPDPLWIGPAAKYFAFRTLPQHVGKKKASSRYVTRTVLRFLLQQFYSL